MTKRDNGNMHQIQHAGERQACWQQACSSGSTVPAASFSASLAVGEALTVAPLKPPKPVPAPKVDADPKMGDGEEACWWHKLALAPCIGRAIQPKSRAKEMRAAPAKEFLDWPTCCTSDRASLDEHLLHSTLLTTVVSLSTAIGSTEGVRKAINTRRPPHLVAQGIAHLCSLFGLSVLCHSVTHSCY